MFFLIVFSVLSLCIATVPQLKDWPGWSEIDAVTSIIFTLEFIIRFSTTGRKFPFVIEPLNIIDFCSFLPYYLELVLKEADVPEATSMNYLGVLRIFRLMKVIKVSRFMSSYLDIFKDTLILARHSVSMLMSLIGFGTTVLATLVYSVEEEAGTFSSIFEAMYWCVITQTTVGYGDIQVVTDTGRLIACITAYTGIFNLTIMVNVMGSCFDEAYTRFLTEEENKFKQELCAKMKGNSISEVGKLSFTDLGEESKPDSTDSSYEDISCKLIKIVASLNYSFSDLPRETWIFNCNKELLEEMNEVNYLLLKAIDYVESKD